MTDVNVLRIKYVTIKFKKYLKLLEQESNIYAEI